MHGAFVLTIPRLGYRSRRTFPRAVGLHLLLFCCLCLISTSAIPAERESSSLVTWLMTPIDPARAHVIDGATSWHGRLMAIVWALLFPAGILSARFFKIIPGQNWPHERDNKRWWQIHLSTQYVGGVLLLLALWLSLKAVGSGQDYAIDWHHVLGWSVAVLVAWQFLSGWLRGSKGGPTAPAPDGSLHGDHYDMTRRRRAFEYAHKAGGYLALLMACIAIISGLFAANAPHWMWLGLLCWWAFLIGLTAWLQASGFARDTYEAIWGPDTEHPGNRLKPIGLGIRRVKGGTRPEQAD